MNSNGTRFLLLDGLRLEFAPSWPPRTWQPVRATLDETHADASSSALT